MQSLICFFVPVFHDVTFTFQLYQSNWCTLNHSVFRASWCGYCLVAVSLYFPGVCPWSLAGADSWHGVKESCYFYEYWTTVCCSVQNWCRSLHWIRWSLRWKGYLNCGSSCRPLLFRSSSWSLRSTGSLKGSWSWSRPSSWRLFPC